MHLYQIMIEKWIAASPIPQLFIETDMNIDDFIVLKNTSKEKLKSDYGIDFDEMHFNHFERGVWTSSPIYAREFDATESDFFQKGSAHLHHFLDSLVLFKPSKFFMPKYSLIVTRKNIRDGVNLKFDHENVPKHRDALFELNNGELSDFKDFFKKCYQYFTKESSNEIDNAIFNSAKFWLAKARQATNIIEREMFLTIITEALVGTNDQELSFRLYRRIALLIGENQTECEKIYRIMKENYGFRSAIVHGNSIKGKKLSDTYEIAEIVRCLLLRFISFSNLNYTENPAPKLDVVFDDNARKKFLDDGKSLFSDKTLFRPLSPDT